MTSFLSGKLAIQKASPPCETNKKPLALLMNLARVRLRQLLPFGALSASVMPALVLVGALATAVTMPAPAEAIVISFPPLNIKKPSAYWAWSCGSFPGVPFTSCWSRPFGKWGKKLYLVIDPPGHGLKELVASFHYDRSLLAFDASSTSLLCELRSPLASAYCPVTSPGSGTMPIGTLDPFEVDQTGLHIQESSPSLMYGSVSLQYSSSVPLSIDGERNFLALAFDAKVPFGEDATVTYSPDLAGNSNVFMGDLLCNGGALACGSSHPTASMRLNPGTAPVPGPLAVAGLPVMLHASRRLRRRVQRAGR